MGLDSRDEMKVKDKRKISIPDPSMGPFGFTISSIKKAITGLKTLFKNPKVLILTLVISVLQTGLAYLKIYLPTSDLVKYASLITFAQGGMYAGLLGAVGGIIGKGFYTWFINTLVFSSLKKKGTKKVKQLEPNPKGVIALAFAGTGLALITYNFLSGNASLENSVIGITAMAASFRTLKQKNGFLVGFICSFTKGRMTTSAAGVLIKGMIAGFFFGVLSSLKYSGFWCYIAGAIFLVLAFILLLSRRKTLVATAALIVFMGSILPAYALLQVNDKWVTPQQAYGIKGDTLTSYMELANAVNASPPANMELTLVAVGAKFFDRSVSISPQKVLVENGQSGSFTVNAQFSDMRLDSLVSLHLEEDGYYASSSTTYSVNDSWTNDETEEGTYQTDKKSYFSFRHLGAANYLYAAYLEPGKFYMEIDIPFAYGDFAGQSKVDSATQILVRVDLVKRDFDEGEQPVSGVWELKETLTYMLIPGNNFVNETEQFTGQWSGSDSVDQMNINVTGTEINLVRTRTHVNGQWIYDITANFTAPPSQLKAFDTFSLPINETGTFYDSEKNTTEALSFKLASAGFLSGRRGDGFNTKINPNDTMAYPFGADLGQVWLELSDGQLVASVPPGTTAGEIMTLEMALGVHDAYDTTLSRIWEIPVIAYVYEWKGGTIPTPDDEDESDEHANEEETGVISALAAIAGLVGAAAAVAGFGGGFGSNNTGYIKRNKEGDLVVSDPVTGEERTYVANANTGRYTNPLTGAEYTEDELQSSIASRAENAGVLRQDYEQSEQAKAEQRVDNQNLSRAENDMRAENKMRAVQSDLEQKGKDGDELAAAMAVKLNKINTQKRETGSYNTKDFEQFKKTHSRWTTGAIAGNSGLPKAESEWDIFKQGLANTGEEIARGESYKSIALRVAVSMLVGSFAARQAISAAGAAVVEAGMEFVQSTFVMKDYVDQGGNDWKEGAQKAIVKTLQGEAMGRAFGYGLGTLGKAASKTGQIMSKVKVGKIVVDGISNFGEKAGKVLNTNVGDMPDALRKMCKEASESAMATKMANAGIAKLKNSLVGTGDNTGRSLDELTKKVDNVPNSAKKVNSTSKDVSRTSQATETASKVDGVKPENVPFGKTGKNADSVSNKTGDSSSDMKTAKSNPIQPKDTAEYKKVSKEVDDSLSKAQERAADKIEKYKNNVSKDPELAARKAAHEEGGKIGLEKVNRLEQARKNLANHPDSPELKKEFEKTVSDVQKNKHAQKIMNERELTNNATRQEFNRLKVEKDAVISMNSSERIAAEYGLDPKNVSNVQATNNMNTGGVGDIKGVASKGDLGTSDGRIPRKFNESDVDASRLEQKGGDKISIDLDQTYRMKITMKDGTVVYKDLPAHKIRQIQNEEVYKAWNDGKLPLKEDGSVDYEKVKDFANDMDYTVVDARSPDAYGTVGDLQQALKNDGSIRQYGDPEVVSKTIKYKSDEWLEKAEFKTGKGNLIDAEGDVAEGVRQATKQFDSQLVYQVKAINTKAGTTKITIPEKLSEGMSVLKQIGHGKGKLSPAEAEAVLKEMGTNTDEILKLNSEQTEFINRLIAGRYKDE
ncbi:MAG: hypothetical protein AB9921_04520 [Erysipelotrichaceae bacterium]